MNNTDKLRAVLAYDTLILLKEKGRMQRGEVLSYLKNKYENPNTEYDKKVKEEIEKNGWKEYYTIAIAGVNWLVKSDEGERGFWSISDEGKKALETYKDPESLFEKALELYNEIQKEKKDTLESPYVDGDIRRINQKQKEKKDTPVSPYGNDDIRRFFPELNDNVNRFFDFGAEIFKKLGYSEKTEHLFYVSLYNNRIRLIYGQIVVLSITKEKNNHMLHVVCSEKLSQENGETHRYKIHGLDVPMTTIPLDRLKDIQGSLHNEMYNGIAEIDELFKIEVFNVLYVINKKFEHYKHATNKYKKGSDELLKALFDKEYRQKLFSGEPEEPPTPVIAITVKPLSKPIPEKLKPYIRALDKKKQIILNGPPGTGKTYNAKKIANFLTDGDASRLKIVQFHPSYSYEDFISGLRPCILNDGRLSYKYEDGTFLSFCKEAEKDKTKDFVIIIDEINRGNIPQIFGELMYALEYREEKITLPNKESFTIPGNLYIIGTMNTADRSIALLDFALRRRFRFFRIDPDFEALEDFHKKNRDINCKELISLIKSINEDIQDADYFIGTSFFMKENIQQKDLEDIYKYEIYPYLEEYFYGEKQKAEKYTYEKIRGRIEACFKNKSIEEESQTIETESHNDDENQQ